MIPHRTTFRIFKGHAQTMFLRHCDADCPYEYCSELAADLWERMTFGGVQFGNLGFQHVHKHWDIDCIGVSHGWQKVVFGIR